MRSPSRLLARIEALELAIKPKPRTVVYADFDEDPASYDERLASFKIENAVVPGDELHIVSISFA